MDPVSAIGLAASIDQFVELAASLANTLYSYYQKVKEAPKRSRELRAEVLLVSDVLQELGSIFQTIPSGPMPTSASLATTVDEFSKLLKEMSSRITVIKNDEITRRLKWPFTQKQNEDFLARLERFKNTFNMALNTLVHKKLQIIEESTEDLQKMGQDTERSQREDKRMQILQWIYPGDVWSRHTAVSRDRVSNSGTWLLNHDIYQQWLNGESGNVLCCQGIRKSSSVRNAERVIAGAGKTFLTSLVIDDISKMADDSTCVAFVYLDYNDSKSQTTENILRSLLKHLLFKTKSIPPEVEAAYEASHFQNRQDISALIRQFISITSTFDSVVVIFDALDECGSYEILNDIVAFIQKLKAANVKVFCTSRPHLIDLTKQLDTPLFLPIEAHDEDVKRYLLIELSKRWEWTDGEDLKLEIVTRLADGAKGKFLLVKFQLDYILDRDDARDAIESLDALPTDMEEAYTETLGRIERAKRKTAQKVLSLLFYAQRPLRIGELREAVSVRTKPADKQLYPKFFTAPDLLVRCCQGLVELDQNTGIVRFTHFTVQEFLQKKYMAKLLPEADIAKLCLTYLSFDVFELGRCRDESSFNLREKSHQFGRYAMQYWGYHTRGKSEADEDMIVALTELLKSPSKRAAIHQVHQLLEETVDDPWKLDVTPTALHIIAKEGLSTFYRSTSTANTISITDFGRVESKTGKGFTPLIVAVVNGHDKMALELLDRGANIHACDKWQWTSLHWAAFNGQQELVLTLLERGADIGAVNIDGWTAFHWAAFNGHENIVTLLIEKGAQILAVTGDGWTAAELADSNGHKDVTLRIRSKDLLASLFAIVGADTGLDSVIPVLRFFIACPRSGSTCLMRIFNENELCSITSCLIQMRYKEQEYQPDYTVLQTPTHNRIYNMAKRKKKHFLVSKEELSNGQKTYPYDVLPNVKAYEITKPAVLFRDPVRVFDSWKRLGWANFDVFVKTYKKLYEISDGEKAFRVIYENMLSDPAKEISDLCLWWEIPFQETMLEFKQPFTTFLENLLPRTITFAGGVIAIGGSNSYYGGYPNTSSGYSGYPNAGPQYENLRPFFEGIEGPPGVDSHYYAWEDPEVKAESAYPNTFSPFSTLQATDTIVSKIQSHRSLSNDEILRVEDEVGLLYIKSLGSRVSGLRNALLARNWYGFNLDETLHEFDRMVDGATTLLTPMNQEYDLPRLKLESGSSFRDHISYAITDPERGQQISEFLRSNFKTEQHPHAEVSDRLAKQYPQYLGPSLEVKYGVLSLFDSLKRMGKKIAIFTTGSRHLRMWMLQELGLWDLVDRLETSNSRSGFNCLFKDAFEYFSDNAIYIGGSLNGISAAQEQGVYCIHYSEAENISLQSTPPRINNLIKVDHILGL